MKSSPLIWHYVTSRCQINSEDFVNFCGHLRKHELWEEHSLFLLPFEWYGAFFSDIARGWWGWRGHIEQIFFFLHFEKSSSWCSVPYIDKLRSCIYQIYHQTSKNIMCNLNCNLPTNLNQKSLQQHPAKTR